jgi:hypothetical protein
MSNGTGPGPNGLSTFWTVVSPAPTHLQVTEVAKLPDGEWDPGA